MEMTQEEFDARFEDRYVVSSPHYMWPDKWKAFKISTNTARCIRALAVDGELWLFAVDIYARLGFNNVVTLCQHTQQGELILFRGLNHITEFDIALDCPTPPPVRCNMINTYGVLRVIEKLRSAQITAGLSPECSSESSHKFGTWLEQHAIPSTEQKIKDAPTIGEVNKKSFKVGVNKRHFDKPATKVQKPEVQVRSGPVSPYNKAELLKIADYVDANAQALVLSNPVIFPEVNKYSSSKLQLMVKFFKYGLNGELPPSWEEYVKILNPEYYRYLEVKAEYMKLKEQFEPTVKESDPVNINDIKQRLQNIAKDQPSQY